MLSILTFIGVLIIIGLTLLLIHVLRARHDKTDGEIKSAIDRVDFLAENNALDHDGLNKKLDKQGGRLQFLTAKEIAVELAEEKAREIMRQSTKDDTQ